MGAAWERGLSSPRFSEARRLYYFEWTGKSTLPELKVIPGTKIQEVAVGEVEVGDAVGGSEGEVFTDSCP